MLPRRLPRGTASRGGDRKKTGQGAQLQLFFFLFLIQRRMHMDALTHLAQRLTKPYMDTYLFALCLLDMLVEIFYFFFREHNRRYTNKIAKIKTVSLSGSITSHLYLSFSLEITAHSPDSRAQAQFLQWQAKCPTVSPLVSVHVCYC